MKRKDLYGLLEGFEAVKNLQGVKFAYARAKNKKLVLNEIELINESMKMTDEYLEYEKKRVELCKEFCEKNEKGTPVIKNNTYAGLTGNTKFDEKLKKLREEFKEVIDARETQIEESNKMLDEEVEIDFHMILLKDVPINITGVQLESIASIVTEK